MKKAIIMGNGPSLSELDFELLKGSKISTYATNRIASLCKEKKWHPEYYCAFFSAPHQGQRLRLSTGEIKDYSKGSKEEGLSAQKDIEYMCRQENIVCYVHEWYKHFLKEDYKNVNFVKPKLWNRFQEFPMGIMDKYNAPNNFLWWIATTSLFQLAVHHDVDTIGMIGIDGYNTSIKHNHYDGYEGSDPGNMQRSNKKITRQHKVICEYLERKNINVYNMSEKSIIKNYPYISLDNFIEL
jgi:hypothetical protein